MVRGVTIGWIAGRNRVVALLRVIGFGLLCGAAIYGFGLTRFVAAVPRGVVLTDQPTDAIVVLTGGSQRVATGLRLLSDGVSGRLFVSGVNRDVELSRLLATAAPSQTTPCCIELGHAADDTVGNAEETARWVRANDIRSLRLVTASYHMPRSLLEFHRLMPGVALVPHPVFPSGFVIEEWWRHRGSLALMATEYHKYLLAWLRHRAEGLLGLERARDVS